MLELFVHLHLKSVAESDMCKPQADIRLFGEPTIDLSLTHINLPHELQNCTIIIDKVHMDQNKWKNIACHSKQLGGNTLKFRETEIGRAKLVLLDNDDLARPMVARSDTLG